MNTVFSMHGSSSVQFPWLAHDILKIYTFRHFLQALQAENLQLTTTTKPVDTTVYYCVQNRCEGEMQSSACF